MQHDRAPGQARQARSVCVMNPVCRSRHCLRQLCARHSQKFTVQACLSRKVVKAEDLARLHAAISIVRLLRGYWSEVRKGSQRQERADEAETGQFSWPLRS